MNYLLVKLQLIMYYIENYINKAKRKWAEPAKLTIRKIAFERNYLGTIVSWKSQNSFCNCRYPV